ncbi:zinc-dependent metalloprotease [Tessaracoccus antarcticus]|nr:zinc-dependent metalloprotease [Tessaracoccus antarcticus]
MHTLPPIDWSLARRVARPIAGPLPEVTRREALSLVSSLRLAARRAGPLAAQASELNGSPAGKVIVCDRDTWAGGAGAMVGGLLGELSLLESDAGVVRTLRAAGHGILAGLAFGVVGRHLLGQYDPATSQLFLLAPNILQLQRARGFVAEDFQLWVATHEQTHAVQFSAAPWLRAHLQERFDIVALDEVDASDVVRGLVGGRGLSSSMASPEAHEALSEVTSTMTLLEGHADYVSDVVGATHIPSVRTLRAAFARTGTASTMARLLPALDKGAQYRDGLRFCRRVAARAGADGLAAAFDAPENLPRMGEIAEPHTWLRRVHGTS